MSIPDAMTTSDSDNDRIASDIHLNSGNSNKKVRSYNAYNFLLYYITENVLLHLHLLISRMMMILT